MTFHYSNGPAPTVRFTDVDGDELVIEPSQRQGRPAVSLRTIRGDGGGGAAVHVLADETDELLAAVRRTAHHSTGGEPPHGLAGVQFARRFVLQHAGHPDMHGVQFPFGRVLADDPCTGLVGAVSVESLVGDDPAITVHWADESAGSPS
ncbi:hypothetical protein OG824_31625 [Streptomyces prunicolor]|uniref:hypothetical protein n=1 Tax=Streptomyces prunicolor TaxID=67348 RepID=UPI002251CA1A|nr:hypothetical protein [Streptomyces prunicolor]MCX5239760.1 hypothetical protein [Streptomyces prunicolor]